MGIFSPAFVILTAFLLNRGHTPSALVVEKIAFRPEQALRHRSIECRMLGRRIFPRNTMKENAVFAAS